MKTVVVIQARTGSTRLPGKVMLPCAGASVLARMLERVTAATTPSDVVVATTARPEDDVIVEVARQSGVEAIRGHDTDLLDRHIAVARATGAEVVVKIPSDCPLIDPATIDRVIGAFLTWRDVSPLDYVSNLHPPSWPDGFDVEVMTRTALEIAWEHAHRPHEREHTTPFLWDNPARFFTGNVSWETGLDYSRRYRLTLDYAEDYAVIRRVFETLWTPRRVFTLADILQVLDLQPAENAMHLGTSWYRNHPGAFLTLDEESHDRP